MAEQRDRAWVSTASDAEIVAAYNDGALQTFTGRAADAPVQRTERWLTAATPEQIAAAHEAGELVELEGGRLDELGRPDK